MSQPFVGEIRMFAGNFAPQGWAFCQGQLLAIAQNDALFSLLGTIYGGDGRTTFGLPDCRGRVPVGMGSGPGLTARPIGAKSGSVEVTLIASQVPAHDHGNRVIATTTDGTTTQSSGNMFAKSVGTPEIYHAGTGRGSSPVNMNADALESVGQSQPHTNMAPSLTLNFIISLFGVYPSRN